MQISGILKLIIGVFVVALVSACATQPPAQMDYTAFKDSRPASILVLPPINNSPEIDASAAVLAQATAPLSESGYYVLPVALVVETFRENGWTTASDVHNVELSKLREVFGADAVLYLTIQQYGASYTVVDSTVVVRMDAQLTDLTTGATLWTGSAAASDANNNSNQGGIVGMLVSAIVKQIANSVTDTSYPVAGIASKKLLSAGHFNGLLYGPRSPKFQTD
jgi:hypothetical protein